jgi:hypothetical protein
MFARECSYWVVQSEQVDPSEAISNRNQYAVALRSKLGRHRLLYVAETDCIDQHGRMIELKTQRKFDANNTRQLVTFHRFVTVDD